MAQLIIEGSLKIMKRCNLSKKEAMLKKAKMGGEEKLEPHDEDGHDRVGGALQHVVDGGWVDV